MAKPLRIAPDAEDEASHAVAWIERSTGRGDALRSESNAALDRIREMPAACGIQWTSPEGTVVRGARLKTFTYRYVFFETADEIRVIAFMHLHQEPLYWADRL